MDYVKYFNEKFLEYINLPRDNKVLHEGLIYATVDGGKRIRPLGVYLGALAIKGKLDQNTMDKVVDLGITLELIHNYSLVHDDLPAMDNDDYRRGKLSTFKKFGEANGILIGDYLLTESYNKAVLDSIKYGVEYGRAVKFITDGALKMVEGQVLDLEGMKTENEYLSMYSLKTGALFKAAFLSGAKVAGANDKELKIIENFAEKLGLAFQIADDLLDQDDDNSIIKAIGKDRAKIMLDQNTKSAVALSKELKFGEKLGELALTLENRKY